MAKQQSDVRERTRLSHDLPRMYRVIMHNDDFTTMEFVVEVLRKVFFKPEEEANQLMLKVHKEGKAIVGLYTLDIAVSKSQKAMRMARDQGFPFKLTWEPEERDIPF
jgi:ATP-dependent Clp protease adaptor protein ClpS